MRVVAFNGSSRKDGNTAILVRKVFAELEAEGIETELVQLVQQALRAAAPPASSAPRPRTTRCSGLKDDGVNACIEKMVAADGIIIASPTYYANCTAHDAGAPGARRLRDAQERQPAGAQGRRRRGRRQARRRHPRLRQHQPLVPDQRDDRRRLELLEHRHRPRQGRRRERTTKAWRPWSTSAAPWPGRCKKLNA